jgi:hypothetical protein
LGQVEQRQAEVAAGEAAVADRIGGEFGRDEGDGSDRVGGVRETGPLGELLDGELAGEACSASGAAEAQGEVVGGGAGLCLVGEVGLCHVVSVDGRVGL